MITVSHEEIMRLKYDDRDSVPGLERHADGACVHLGPISPACEICFTGVLGGGIQVGQECMFDCPECYYKRDRKDMVDENPDRLIKDIMADFFRKSLDPNWLPRAYSYQSTGETLMYIDQLKQMAPIFRNIEKTRGINVYHILYTNGVLIDEAMLETLKWMQIDEIRFHLSASDFSDEAFKAMELVQADGTIKNSVEEPSMPHRREQILSYLDTFEELDVQHLNLIECQITQHNKPHLEELYPGDAGRMYKEHFYQLYDEGLVYEVMRQRQKRGHSYSVMDCNSMVESYRHGKYSHIGFNQDTLEGMCAPYKYRR